MKKILYFFLVLISVQANAQRWGMELGMNYLNGNPVGGMGRVIDRAHGLSMNFGVINPDNRFSVGLDLSFAQYGRDKSRQLYQMEDGTNAEMDIIVSNAFSTLSAAGTWNIVTTGAVRPYLSARLGYAWYNTSLNIYDPDDLDHCEPVDSEQLHKDGAFVASVGAGTRFDLSKIFGRLDSEKLFLDLSYNVTQGGNVQYMKTHGPTPGPHHHGEGDEVTADFINTQTQVIHKHHVGYLYSNFIQMSEVRAGLTLQVKWN